MSAVPKNSWPWVKTLLHSVYDQPDAESVHAQFDRVLDALEHKLPKAFAHLDAARVDILAFTVFPKELWRQISSNDPISVNKEIKRLTDVVGVLPNPSALLRLAGSVLIEQHDEWEAGERRYFLRGLDA
jgi:putative transposase